MLGKWADKFEWKGSLLVGSVFAFIGVLRFDSGLSLLSEDNLLAAGFITAGLINLALAWRNRPGLQKSEANLPRIGK